jgi:hypothetical protein
MTKADIVTEISNKTGIDRNDVLAIVEGFMGTVKKSMCTCVVSGVSLLKNVQRSWEGTFWQKQPFPFLLTTFQLSNQRKSL